MTKLNELLNQLPSSAKDAKINLQSVLNQDNNILSSKQIFLIALASAFNSNNEELILAIKDEAQNILDDNDIEAAKKAASIMAMNTVYYRFIHLTKNSNAYLELPAGLRMQAISNHNIAKVDFEAMSLAIAALEGCGMCINAHENTLGQEGLTKTQIQMVIKIDAVIKAVSSSLILK